LQSRPRSWKCELGVAHHLLDTASQVGTYLVQLLSDTFPLVNVDHRQHGRQGHGCADVCESRETRSKSSTYPEAHHLTPTS
jgi:hypothetical protein